MDTYRTCRNNTDGTSILDNRATDSNDSQDNTDT